MTLILALFCANQQPRRLWPPLLDTCSRLTPDVCAPVPSVSRHLFPPDIRCLCACARQREKQQLQELVETLRVRQQQTRDTQLQQVEQENCDLTVKNQVRHAAPAPRRLALMEV